MADTAARMRRYRARRNSGRMVVRVEIDDVKTPAELIAAGYLAEHLQDDPAAIARALERAIADFRAALLSDA